jgi:hypothetical protein
MLPQNFGSAKLDLVETSQALPASSSDNTKTQAAARSMTSDDVIELWFSFIMMGRSNGY